MSGFRVGSGYVGSPDLQTSVANAEIIPSDKTIYKFSFMNQGSCHVSVNGETAIYLSANQGFEMSMEDFWITSFKIAENGIIFNWIGAYR